MFRPHRQQQLSMEELTKQVNKLIEKTTLTDPRLKEEVEEMDRWMQQSQPLPSGSDYSSTNEKTKNDQETVVGEGGAEKSPDFFPTKKPIAKRKKVKHTATRIKYSLTGVKSKNFLSNISYSSTNKADFYNKNFILDVFILLVKNLNPFSLPCKISDKFKHEMIYVLWRECIPPAFYRFICQEDNFRYLNGRDVSQPGVLEIVGKFVDQDKNNLRLLQQYLANYKDIFQYVDFPKYNNNTIFQKKTVDNKEKEKQMWEKLGELNKKLKDIKKLERAGEKKMLATIV